jgi:AcrR family transcriptional regulator
VNDVQKDDGVLESGVTGAEARRARNRREMQEAILAEARRIVSEDGVDALSMRGIARALGYSPGALYDYFRDREAIVHGLYFTGTGGLGGRLAEAMAATTEDTDPFERICILGRAYRAFALENPELYRLAFGRIAPKERSDEARGGFDVLVRAVQLGIERGALIEGSPEAFAFTCWAGVHGFVSLELTCHVPGTRPDDASPEGRRQRDAMFEGVMQSLLFGLARDDYRAARGGGSPAGPGR